MLSLTTDSAPTNSSRHFQRSIKGIISARPIRGRRCFAEASAHRNNCKGGPRNAITSSKTSRSKNIPSFIIARIPKCAGCGCPKPSKKRVKT